MTTEELLDLKQLMKDKYLDAGKPYTITDLFNDICKYLKLDHDRDFFEVNMACSCDRKITGNPVWLYSIAQSGATKTTLADMQKKRDEQDIFLLEKCTPNTLVSGKVITNKLGDVEPVKGLLPYIDGKVLIIKDFMSILTMNRDKRREIFGQLRGIYDGYYDAGYGNQAEKLHIECHIGCIVCTTPVIDDYTVLESLLGTRFLRIRHKSEGNEEAIIKQAQINEGVEEEIMQKLQFLVWFFVDNLKFDYEIEISDEWKDRIRELAHYLAFMRAQVRAEWWKGKIQAITSEPHREVPTRTVKQLQKLGKLLCYIRRKKEFNVEEWKTLVRVVEDTVMPYTRSRILTLIRENDYKVLSQRDIAEKLGWSRTHVRTTLQLMSACNILEENEWEEDEESNWKLTDYATHLMKQVYRESIDNYFKEEKNP